MPYPPVAVDRYWNVVDMDVAAALFTHDVDPELLGPPLNVYRLSLHPEGLAPRVVNFAELADHLLHRLRHDVEVSAAPDLAALLEEVERYPDVRALPRRPVERHGIVVPIRLRTPQGGLSMFSTITTSGTPVDVTAAELALETFFPADAETAAHLNAAASTVERAG